MNSGRQIILIAVAFLFFTAAALYAGFRIGQRQLSGGQDLTGFETNNNTETVEIDPNAVNIDQTYIDAFNECTGGQDGQSEADSKSMKYHLFTDVSFIADTTEQDLPIWNDPVNVLSFQVTIWLDDDMTAKIFEGQSLPIIKTGAIAPGQMLKQVNLSRPLAAGTYHAVFVYTPVDGEGTKYSTFEAHTTINVR